MTRIEKRRKSLRRLLTTATIIVLTSIITLILVSENGTETLKENYHEEKDEITLCKTQPVSISEHKTKPVAAAEIRDDTNPDITEEDIDLLARLMTAEQGYATSYGGGDG